MFFKKNIARVLCFKKRERRDFADQSMYYYGLTVVSDDFYMQQCLLQSNLQSVFTCSFLEDNDEMTHDDEMTMARAR